MGNQMTNVVIPLSEIYNRPKTLLMNFVTFICNLELHNQFGTVPYQSVCIYPAEFTEECMETPRRDFLLSTKPTPLKFDRKNLWANYLSCSEYL